MFIKTLKFLTFIGMVYFSTDYSRPLEITQKYKFLFGGKFQYLTVLGLYATIYILLIGFIAKFTRSSLLSLAYRIILPVVTTIEFIITVVYWTLNVIDPTLLAGPEYVRNFTTMQMDVWIHLVPFAVLISELMTEHVQKCSGSRIALVLLACNYYFWVAYGAYKSQFWVYPFLNEMSWLGRIVLFVGVTILALISYEIIMWIRLSRK